MGLSLKRVLTKELSKPEREKAMEFLPGLMGRSLEVLGEMTSALKVRC